VFGLSALRDFDPPRLTNAARPRGGGASTSQGHPRTIFRRALERDNLVLAEVTARQIGRVTIAEALELTALVARKQPERYGRFAARAMGVAERVWRRLPPRLFGYPILEPRGLLWD
jgi:hypothetical protein